MIKANVHNFGKKENNTLTKDFTSKDIPMLKRYQLLNLKIWDMHGNNSKGCYGSRGHLKVSSKVEWGQHSATNFK